MLVEEIDDVGFQPLERGLGDFLDVFGPAVEAGLLAGDRINFETELGGDHHLLTEGSESFAHELFVREGTVHFGRVKERDPVFDGRPNQRDPLLLLDCWSEAKAQSHAAQSNSGYFQMAFSKFAFVHYFSFSMDPGLRGRACTLHLTPPSGQ